MKILVLLNLKKYYDKILFRKTGDNMQSVTSKIFMATLRMIFHSPLSDSSKLSDNAAKLTKDKKSRYKPSKNFTYTKHSIEDVKYEKIINKNCYTKKVILMIHGGGFKIELNDFYRKLMTTPALLRLPARIPK